MSLSVEQTRAGRPLSMTRRSVLPSLFRHTHSKYHGVVYLAAAHFLESLIETLDPLLM